MPENRNEKGKLVFDFKRYSLSSGNVPKLAELRLQSGFQHGQGHPRSNDHHELRVAIYDQSGKQVFRKSYRASYQYDRKADDIVYETTSLIQDMIAMSLTNMTVKITLNQDRLNKNGDRNRRSKTQIKADKAFLVVYSQDEKFNEMMKTQEKRFFGGDHDVCSKRDLVIDLSEGTNIVLPRNYNIFKCEGNCSDWALSHVTFDDSATIRLFHRMRHANTPHVPAPCCIPKSYNLISVLTLSSNVYEITTYHSLMVNECGCK